MWNHNVPSDQHPHQGGRWYVASFSDIQVSYHLSYVSCSPLDVLETSDPPCKQLTIALMCVN